RPEALGSEPRRLRVLAERHRDVMASLSQDGREICGLAGRDGAALLDALDEIVAAPAADLVLAPADYAELFHAMIADRAVRRPDTPGARVRIFGPLEARLPDAAVLVLGGRPGV